MSDTIKARLATRLPLQCLSGLIMIGTSCVALATSSVSQVGSPSVTQGKTTFEYRTGFTTHDVGRSTDNQLRLRQQIDSGLTDHWAFRVVFQTSKNRGDLLSYRSTQLQNRFDHGRPFHPKVSIGTRASYTFANRANGPDVFEWRGISRYHASNGAELTTNLLLSHEFGKMHEDGLIGELRNRIKLPLSKQALIGTHSLIPNAVGFELLNDWGHLNRHDFWCQAQHQVGALLDITLLPSVGMEIGYRQGVSTNAPNRSFRLSIQHDISGFI